MNERNKPPTWNISTRLLHADDHLKPDASVSPAISTSTTFKYPLPSDGEIPMEAAPFDPANPAYHVYSRYTQPTIGRAERLLGSILNGHAIVISSGIAAAMSALFFFNPTCIAITGGYHGCHVTIDLFKRIKPQLVVIDLDDDYTEEGMLCWLETPLNPTGECRDIEYYASKVHSVGGKLFVDATFGPPPLQDPFEWGADMIMHSATKYLAGHSDALLGVLCVKSSEDWTKLWHIRTFNGNNPGSLEIWLLMRSLRTLTVRVEKQAKTATMLAQWFSEIVANAPSRGQEFDGCPGGVLAGVTHASLQGKKGGFDPFAARSKQLNGGPACFSIILTSEAFAKWLPHRVSLFVAATSLGGVESLMEQRIVSDANADPKLIRLSIGLEDLEDLKQDIRQAFNVLLTPRQNKL